MTERRSASAELPAPPALASRGLAAVTHDLPPAAGLEFGAHFCRVFRADLEAALFGWRRPSSPRQRVRAAAPATPATGPRP